jgi:hypothetical protein
MSLLREDHFKRKPRHDLIVIIYLTKKTSVLVSSGRSFFLKYGLSNPVIGSYHQFIFSYTPEGQDQ